MIIYKEIPEGNYPDKFIDPNTPLGEFISRINSLINKEQEFIDFISSIKSWSLPKYLYGL